PGDFFAAASLASTIAHAPSEDGHVSRYRIGSHSIGDAFTASSEMSGMCRWAYGFFSAFWRSFTATSIPTSAGAPPRLVYRARTRGAKRRPAPATSGGWNG